MPRFEFDQGGNEGDWVDQSSRLMSLVVRLCGLTLLFVGFVMALLVIWNAWALYAEPVRIENLARAVERGSNLDLTLSKATTAGHRQPQQGADATNSTRTGLGDAEPGLRFSYFIAWLIGILLLMLIGQLSIAAVRTGGELALYDVKVGKLARALLKERTRAS
jgi:hypothetical protein